MPRSRSRSLESMTRVPIEASLEEGDPGEENSEKEGWVLRVPDWRRSWSTRVVFPWSTIHKEKMRQSWEVWSKRVVTMGDDGDVADAVWGERGGGGKGAVGDSQRIPGSAATQAMAQNTPQHSQLRG